MLLPTPGAPPRAMTIGRPDRRAWPPRDPTPSDLVGRGVLAKGQFGDFHHVGGVDLGATMVEQTGLDERRQPVRLLGRNSRREKTGRHDPSREEQLCAGSILDDDAGIGFDQVNRHGSPWFRVRSWELLRVVFRVCSMHIMSLIHTLRKVCYELRAGLC